jgi:hypothetical protein
MNNLPLPTPVSHTSRHAPTLPADPFERLPVNPSAVFTKEQQQAIIEKWWSFKMASIETGKVLEMSDKLDMVLDRASLPNPTSAEVQQWRAHHPRRT